ncbi:alanine racemase [Bartonella ancashensis]|uniref:Alanine racemase n=1 Tax=Bartonella ancashensis TaxID=1318743 RepID=A0A0M3T2I8_9HYPH|nr:alanine racemase [Bartonella ancashensis]ALE02921.1 Alanine racemase [Bartonella ancashensis]
MDNPANYEISTVLPYTAVATIDIGAIVANYKTLAQRVAPIECAAVIKANAYGMGAEKVAPALYQVGCRIFFVAQINEALQLKNILPPNTILAILNDFPPQTEEWVAQAGIVPVLNSWQTIERWQTLCQKKKQRFPAIIQIDTNMNRLGLNQEELHLLIKRPLIFEKATIKYIISHLSSGDNVAHPSNNNQLAVMQNLLTQLPPCKASLANSGGIFLDSAFHFDLVRPGITLYGINPHDKHQTFLKPVLKLEAQVIQSRFVDSGASVGYGGSFVTNRPSILTTIAIGYADGWPYSLSNRGSVYFKEHRLPIVGKVSMDSTIVDATDLEHKKPERGDWVELIGRHQRIEDIAVDANTIPYEILTSLGARCKRIYI